MLGFQIRKANVRNHFTRVMCQPFANVFGMPIFIYNYTAPAQNLFVNELYKIVVKKVVVEIVKDQGWYAETQMKTELKWSA